MKNLVLLFIALPFLGFAQQPSPVNLSVADLKANFGDTSTHAIIHLYRYNKSASLMNDYNVYLDGQLIFSPRKKAKVAYKLEKEGITRLIFKRGKTQSSVTLDIKFGRKYYLECLMHSKTPNPVPEIRLEEPTDGQIAWNIL